MAKAKVILKQAKTYNIGGKRWIKDVPGTVEGEENIQKYEANGFFTVVRLKDAESKAMKKKAQEEDAEDEEVEEQAASKAAKKLKAR